MEVARAAPDRAAAAPGDADGGARPAHTRAIAALGHTLTGEAPSLDCALVTLARARPAAWTTALYVGPPAITP